MELGSQTECEYAMPTIKTKIVDATFAGDIDSRARPGGCYYSQIASGVFWNTNKGGACSTCRSVCKG